MTFVRPQTLQRWSDIMRGRAVNLSGIGISANERVAPEGGWPAPAAAQQPDLTIQQQYALLYLRKAGPESLASKLVEMMRAMGIGFAMADMDVLRERGYARKTDRSGTLDAPFRSKSHHAITPAGLYQVEGIARELARKYGIHKITIHEPRPSSNMGGFAACSCGNWQRTSDRKNWRRLNGYAADHLRSVATQSQSSRTAASVTPRLPLAAAPESGAVMQSPGMAASRDSREAGHG